MVLAALAESAFPARHDLLGHHAVADRDAPSCRGLVVEFHDPADELVAGDHHGLGPGRAVLVAPELGRAVVALQVTGADADRFDADQCLTGAALRNRDLLGR